MADQSFPIPFRRPSVLLANDRGAVRAPIVDACPVRSV